MATADMGTIEKVFLCDGDAISIETPERCCTILAEL